MRPLGGNMRFSNTWKGWILSSYQNDFHTFLYDPRTSDKIALPHFTHDLPRVFKCALSDEPTNNGCIVVNIHPYEPYFWYCRIGGLNEWIKYEYDAGNQQYDSKGLVSEKVVIYTLTSCQGKLYFPVSSVKHGIIEFSPDPVIQIVTMHGMPRDFWARTCNFELDEEPYKFYTFFDDEGNVTDIALYNGGCCPASKFELESNCVYWIRTTDGSMHIFNIVEGTHRVCYRPSEDLPKLSSEAFWLLPSNQTV
ncbi:hypothetical protein HU200_001616 [Digitaria exilis]|uniref:KIB1-4 beta-propeller domain-containing protein n=1 Tax=Digitaria exilis TaxID=1010633 RepID=A0A835KXK7_9POAL|nr:hypothetical protein HU200_001616 [Digitaria exilis]